MLPRPIAPFGGGRHWLGRDAATGATLATTIPDIGRARLEMVTASARRYGFHATLKPPMTLRAGTTRSGLEAALGRFAEGRQPVPLGTLRVALLHGFLALLPAAPSDALQRFAADCVTGFEPFRAPLSPADRAQRLRQGDLSGRQSTSSTPMVIPTSWKNSSST